MRRWRVVLGVLVTVATLSSVAPVPARAASTVQVNFSGTISLWDSYDRCWSGDAGCSDPARPLGLYAPTGPTCDGFCPTPQFRIARWVLGDPIADPDSGGPCTAVTPARACQVHAKGTFGGSFIGPYCGAAQGEGDFSITVGGELYELSGPGNLHPGNVMAWRVTRRNGSGPSGQGVAEMTLSNPQGACGLDPLDDYTPAHTFDVHVSLVWQAV